MTSAYNCYDTAVRALLQKGADVNAANTFSGEVKFGKIHLIHLTPLMAACALLPRSVVTDTPQASARVNEKDSRNMTALMLAVASENQDPEVARSSAARRP